MNYVIAWQAEVSLLKVHIYTLSDILTHINTNIGQPAATDMNELMWDDGLAAMAQNYMEECPGLVHNPDKNTEIYPYYNSGDTKWWNEDNGESFSGSIYIGENLAVTSASYTIDSITSQIESGWFDEYEVYTWNDNRVGSCSPNTQHSSCGHYTAMVWANTRYVGCGYVNGCSGWNGQFVCNYFPLGNMNTGSTPPYQSAASDAEISSDCMEDRTANTASYDSVSTTASEYNDGDAYNSLCGGAACQKMCDGASWSRDNCNHCDDLDSLDCADGTDGINGGRSVCDGQALDSAAFMLKSGFNVFALVLVVVLCVV